MLPLSANSMLLRVTSLPKVHEEPDHAADRMRVLLHDEPSRIAARKWSPLADHAPPIPTGRTTGAGQLPAPIRGIAGLVEPTAMGMRYSSYFTGPHPGYCAITLTTA